MRKSGVCRLCSLILGEYCKNLETDSFVYLPGKVNSPRRVVSSPRKPPQSPRAAKRGGLAPTSLANFFKTGKTMNKDPINTKEEEQKGKYISTVSNRIYDVIL